jgi:arsenical pump membrane protein
MASQHRLGLPELLGVSGGTALIAAIALSPSETRQAAAQTWQPFVLVAGLLTIGVVAHRDGLFDTLGAAVSVLRAPPTVLLVGLLMVVAGVTAVLNLDTSVAFLTPVLVLAARNRGLDEEPFLYGALLMSNSASLLLPGSNLTNLLVLANEHVPGTVFAARMLPAWIAAVAVTTLFTVALYSRRSDGPRPARDQVRTDRHLPWSSLAVIVAAVLMLAVRSPALPVLALGVGMAVVGMKRASMTAAEIWSAVEPFSLAGVFGIAVALGTLARSWGGPAHLMAHAGAAETAVLGAAASVLVNNLPAAVLLASKTPAHPRALLLGLNLGPNLAVTGSLSALLWFQAAKTVGARPSAVRLSRFGAILVPISIAASAVALKLFAPGRL